MILKNNPYRFNRFGMLEIPGLPAIPIAGLTLNEAIKRVGADPDLQQFGDDALKPFWLLRYVRG